MSSDHRLNCFCRYLMFVTSLLLVGLVQPALAVEPGMHGRVNGFTEEGKFEGVVAGAAIEIKSQGGAVVAKTTSGKTGYYRLNLPPGNYFFKVTAEGYKDEDKGRGFAQQLSEGLAVYNFTLTKGKNDLENKPPKIPKTPIGQLEGRVYERVTKGVLVGISKATVTLRLGKSRELTRVVTGNGIAEKPETVGDYRVTLAQGSWKASVVAEGFERLVVAEPIAIVVGETTNRDFILTRRKPIIPSSQGIKGVVTISGSGRTGIPQDQIKIDLIPIGNGQQVGVVPAANGKYQKNLGVGRYRVVAKATGYREARSGPVSVFRGQYSRVDLTLYPDTSPSPITPPGTKPNPNRLVFNGEVGELIKGKVFRPIEGATTRLLQRGQGLKNVRPIRTNETGSARIPVAGPGVYLFLAQKKGYRSGTASVKITKEGENQARLILERLGSPPTKPKPGTTTPTPSKPLPSDGLVNVSGWVVYESKKSTTGFFGVGGTRMDWTRLSPKPAITEQDLNEKAGSYSIKVPAGTYLVSLQPPAGFEPMRKQVVVAAGMKPEYFILKRKTSTKPTPSTPAPSNDLVRVNGYVVYRSKASTTGYKGIPGARLEWKRTDRVSGSRNVTSVTVGRYDTQLPPGSYTVRVVPPSGYQGTTENVTVRKGMAAKYFILKPGSLGPPPKPSKPPTTKPRTYTLTIRIVESVPAVSATAPRSNNRSLAGANVSVRQGLRTVTSGRTGKDGVFTVKVPLGYYTVDASRTGYVTARKTVSLFNGNISTTIVLRKSSSRSGKPTFPKPRVTIPKKPIFKLQAKPKKK